MALIPDEPFTWGAGGARLTPDEITQRRKVADALALQAGDGSAFPTGTRGAGLVTQGLARVAKGVSAGFDYREADQAAKANASENASRIAALLGGAPAAPAAAGAPVASPAPAAAGAPAASPDTTGKIYSNDEPSPLDPPSGQDRDAAIRTVYGEAGNEPTKGQLAVASVIRNRAVDGGYGGDTPTAVVRAPNQFEPWNGGPAKARMLALDPNSPQYAAIGKVVDAAYGTGGRAPDDPTEGKTMFYSPSAQAALGRPAPSWAKGEGQVIGGHTFFDDEDGTPTAKPVQVASNGPVAFAGSPAPSPGVAAVTAAAGGTPAPTQVAATAPTPGTAKVRAAMEAITSPYTDAGTKQIATTVLAQEMKPKAAAPYKDADGNLLQVGPDGLLHVPIKAAEDPTSVREYEYYKKNAPAGQPLMDYATWSTTKARAAATNVNTSVDTRAESEMSKAVGKAQGEVIGEDIKAGSHASNKLRQLATLDEANKSGGDDISSGPFGKAILSGKQGLSELTGVDLKGVPESEVIQKVGFGLATNMVKAISNRPSQMEFGKALENVPGLLMSKEGRVAMTSILTQETHAEQEIGRLANNSENHKNWQEVKDKYYAEHPLISPFTGKPFGEADIQMLTKKGGGVSSTTAAEPKVINGYTIKELP